MVDTKSKIVDKSIDLFNQYGYSNVSLHQIAKALDLSSGNLTYHYPKKEALMDAVYSTFVDELIALQSSLGVGNEMREMIYELSEFIKFQNRFLFFYVDLLNIGRNYPFIAKRHYDHIKGQIKRIENNLNFNLNTGMLKVQFASELEILAETIWMTVVFYPSQMIIRGQDNSHFKLLAVVTSILKPYLKSEYTHVLESTIQNIFSDVTN